MLLIPTLPYGRWMLVYLAVYPADANIETVAVVLTERFVNILAPSRRVNCDFKLARVRYLLLTVFVGFRLVIQILCHVLARGWGRWLRYFTEPKAEVKYRARARIRGPKHDSRFEWPVSILIMTRYRFFPFKTHKTSAKKPRLLTIAGANWFLLLPPVRALPTLNTRTCC